MPAGHLSTALVHFFTMPSTRPRRYCPAMPRTRSTASDDRQLRLVEIEPTAKSPNKGLPSKRKQTTLGDLLAWSNRQTDLISARNQVSRDSDLFLYMQAAKLAEEVGELHAQLLFRSGAQRKSKEGDLNASSVGSELVDVLLCIGIIASTLNIDLNVATAKKIDVIRNRDEVDPTGAA